MAYGLHRGDRMTTASLSLDFNVLKSKFNGLQRFRPASSGWNDMDGGAIYFTASGSEYRLRTPSATASDVALTSSVRTEYRQMFAELLARVQASTGLTSQQQSSLESAINDALAELDARSSLPGLKISAQIDHIRDNQQDDHCALEVDVVWIDALSTCIPTQIKTGFTWGTNSLAVPSAVVGLLSLPSYVGLPTANFLKMMIPYYGEVMLMLTVSRYAMELWNIVVDKLTDIADDGGRLYFPAAVTQAAVRLFASIDPPRALPMPSTIPAPFAGVGGTLQVAYDASSILSDTCYREDTFSIQQKVPDISYIGVTYDATYVVSLPELVWLPAGAGVVLSYKITIDGDDSYAAIVMSFGSDGYLQTTSAVVQVADDVILKGPPMRAGDSLSGAISGFLGTYFSQDAMLNAIGANNGSEPAEEMYLPTIMSQTMNLFANNMVQIAASAIDGSYSPLPTLSINSNQEYDYGSRPVITPIGDGRLVEVHMGDSNTLDADILNVGSAITPANRQGDYQDGQDPSAATLVDGVTVLEIHGGNGNNKLYYNLVTTNNTTTMTFPKNGSSYDKGEDPYVAVANINGSNRIIEVHRAGSSADDTLYYNIGALSKDDISWTDDGQEYASGVTPCAAFLPGSSIVVTAHAKAVSTTATYVETCVGNVGTSSVSWSSTGQQLTVGLYPTVAVTSDRRVVLLYNVDINGSSVSSQYTSVACAIGTLDGDNAIHWQIYGEILFNGTRPDLHVHPKASLVGVYESQDNAGQVYGLTASIVLPDGY